MNDNISVLPVNSFLAQLPTKVRTGNMQETFAFQYWIEFIATTAFTVSGITKAARHEFDAVSVYLSFLD